MRKNKNQPTTSRRSVNQSPNASTFSYYSSRSSSDSNTGRLTKTVTKSFKWQYIPSFIALVAILLSLAYVSTLSTKPRLKIKAANSAQLLQAQSVYAEAAERSLQKSLFSRSKLMIDTKSIEAELREQFPELNTVGITVPLTSRNPIVTIEAVEPRLILVNTKGVFVLDTRGRAVLRTSDAKAFNVPVITDETGLEIEVGKGIISGREVAFMSELNHQLTKKSIVIESLILPTVVNELYLRPKGQGYFVKFNMLGDPRLQAGTYLAMVERLGKDNQMPSEYIDVRVEEKAFYR